MQQIWFSFPIFAACFNKGRDLLNQLTWYHYDSFSNQPHKGNPAGVIFVNDSIEMKDFQKIAELINFNETVFISHSTSADFKFQFFAPKSEMDFCGHALLAGIKALIDQAITHKKKLDIETNVGIIPINILDSNQIEVKQNFPLFKSFSGSAKDIAKLLSISVTEIDEHLPIVYGNTGTWTLIVPIKSLSSFKRMKPLTDKFPDILSLIPASSIHPICLETQSEHANLYSRHFSGAYTGAIEDAVTGSASGVMGAYYYTYIKNLKNNESGTLLMEQGYELNKEGFVTVEILQKNEKKIISVSGQAVLVSTNEVSI